jgi:DHA2 family methylenomycin A resistance protein-like MFS transporter
MATDFPAKTSHSSKRRRLSVNEKISPAVIIATALGFALVQLDVSIVNVALPTIGNELHSGIGLLQWVVDAYAVTFASLLLLGGALGDRVGARRCLVAGFGIFILGSTGCGFAASEPMLIGSRIVQGIGAALLVPCSLVLLSNAFGDDLKARARAIGLWTAAGSVALALGPIAGGLLVTGVGWRAIFLINIPIGALGIWLALRHLKETRPSDRALDLPGQVFAVVALATVTASVIATETMGWFSPIVLGGFALASVSLGLFVMIEARAKAPMLPLDFFRRPAFSVSALVGLAINLTLYGAIFILSLYLQRIHGYSALQTGFAFLPFCVVLGCANVLSGRLVAKHGPRFPMTAGLVIAAGGYLALTVAGSGTPYWELLPGLVIVPLGIGMAVPAMTAALLSSVEQSRAGIASGVLNMVRQAAGAIGVAFFGALLSIHGVSGVHASFIISAILLTLAGAAAFAMIRQSA